MENHHLMTDLEFGISNAGEKVWPNSNWNLCYFHVQMDSSEKMDSLKVPQQIQRILKKQIAALHETKTEDEA